nr:MAG TPA: hypothetical protein [Caudoviricetes sp.]
MLCLQTVKKCLFCHFSKQFANQCDNLAAF